jgi:hypothetical protein
VDLAVGVGSNRDREIGRKKGQFLTQKGVMENFELNDEHLVLKLVIARFNLADFWDVTGEGGSIVCGGLGELEPP